MSHSEIEGAEPTVGQRGLNPRQLWRLAEFRRRLAYIDESYRLWSATCAGRPDINESLAALRRSLHGSARRRRNRVRLNPEIEIAICVLAAMRAGRSHSSEVPTQTEPADIEAACEELIEILKPIRGRPNNRMLRHHVQGLIVLCEWAAGVPVTASPTTNSDYKPQMTSPGAKTIEMAFKRIDPSVTTTTLMNIVRRTRARRELEGKRFEDFFPGYQAEYCPEIGLPQRPPNVCLKLLRAAHPIYCS